MNTKKLNLSGHFNKSLDEQGFEFHGTVQIDPEKPFGENLEAVTKYLQSLGVESNTVVTVAVPGMSVLATMVLVALHGLTGNFPIIATLVREANGEFVCKEQADLQTLRNNVSRNLREKVVTL